MLEPFAGRQHLEALGWWPARSQDILILTDPCLSQCRLVGGVVAVAGPEQFVEHRLPRTVQQRRAQPVVVLAVAESLGAVEGGKTFLFDAFQHPSHGRCLQRVDLSDFDDKSVSSEIASAQSSIGSNGPEQSHPFMIEVAGGLLEMRGNADPLSGHRGFVFHTGVPDITAVAAKGFGHHGHQFAVACGRFLNENMQVVAFSGGIAPGDFLNLEIFRPNFDASSDAFFKQTEGRAGVFIFEFGDEIH